MKKKKEKASDIRSQRPKRRRGIPKRQHAVLGRRKVGVKCCVSENTKLIMVRVRAERKKDG